MKSQTMSWSWDLGPKNHICATWGQKIYKAVDLKHIMTNTLCGNCNNKCSYQISISCHFFHSSKQFWFCHVDFALLIILTKKTSLLQSIRNVDVTIIKCFTLCKGFSTYLSILKCISKWLHFTYARYEHFTTHSQCQRHTNTNNIKQEPLTQIMNI